MYCAKRFFKKNGSIFPFSSSSFLEREGNLFGANSIDKTEREGEFYSIVFYRLRSKLKEIEKEQIGEEV